MIDSRSVSSYVAEIIKGSAIKGFQDGLKDAIKYKAIPALMEQKKIERTIEEVLELSKRLELLEKADKKAE